jgi:hypothetical protein
MNYPFLIAMLIALLSTLNAEEALAIQTVNSNAVPVSQKLNGEAVTPKTIAGVRRALIACSLPGDEIHLEQFKESITLIRSSLIKKFGFDDSNVRIQFGRSEDDAEPDDWKTHGRSTKEELLKEASTLVKETTDADTTWVFLIGHSYFDGKSVFYNVPDVDIKHEEFAASFKELKGSSVFFICTPASGYFIKGLSQANRVVITSSEANAETNGSIFHTHLAKTLEAILPGNEFDFDNDGKVTLVDLYIKTTRDMVDEYLTGSESPLYPTEHPNIDDNGDGRGTELQINYLTPEQGGRMGKKLRKRKNQDGPIAAQSPLLFDIKESRTDKADLSPTKQTN